LVKGLLEAAFLDYGYTSNSGARTLTDGELVRVADDYTGCGLATCPEAGFIFEYTGPTATIDLGAVNYSTGPWDKLLLQSFDSIGFSFKTKATAGGGIAVVNDVRGGVTAEILDVDVTAGTGITVTAKERAVIQATDISLIIAEGGSGSSAYNGIIATNLVLSGAHATIDSADLVATSGDVVVGASNTSFITAVITSETKATSAGVGVTLAFNTIGWDSQNILFNFADALLGLDIGTQKPAETITLVTGSTISAGGGIAITAVNHATINAHIATSAATFDKGFTGSATAVTVDAVVAMNKVSTKTQAILEDAPAVVLLSIPAPSVEAKGGDLVVTATDSAVITSFVEAPVTAVSLAFKDGTSVGVAVSLSRNDVRVATDAEITDVPWSKASGNILVAASDAMQIDATSTASAITVAISLKGSLAFSGGGATAVNRILGHTNATVTSSKLEAGGTLGITTAITAGIDALVTALAVAIGGGLSGTTPGIAIGFSLARNLIGWAEYGGVTPIEVKARAISAELKAAGDITVSATSTAAITAVVQAT
ncbi:MAG: hypothetical protein WBO89_03020, partial [Propionicimonas sp.]